MAATDDPDYATQIHEVLAGEASLKNVHATAWVDEVPGRMPTAYELEWRAEGRRMHYFSYRRREASA
jgi:tRNA G46 methylase TrmB